MILDRYGGLVAMFDGPDNVERAKGGVASEKHAFFRRLECDFIDNRNFPLIKLYAGIFLNPWKGVFLANRQYNICTRDSNFAR